MRSEFCQKVEDRIRRTQFRDYSPYQPAYADRPLCHDSMHPESLLGKTENLDVLATPWVSDRSHAKAVTAARSEFIGTLLSTKAQNKRGRPSRPPSDFAFWPSFGNANSVKCTTSPTIPLLPSGNLVTPYCSHHSGYG
jgi:hypothetical protein